MLWACLALPDLALEAVFSDPQPGMPRALFDGPTQRPQIVACNEAARARGVRCGHSLAEARSLSAQLQVQRRQPRSEHETLHVLAGWAYGYSSQVVIEAPDALLLEVGASLGLFGGWPRLQALLHEGLQALGHRHVLAAAPSPAGAERLARSGQSLAVLNRQQLLNALGDLALEHCGLAERHARALQAVGWRRLGELFRVPRAELARRFDAGLPEWLDRLRGDRPDPRPLYRPPDRFDRLIEFDGQIESLEGLSFPLQRLCRELAAYLHSRDGGVLNFLLLCGHDDAPATPIGIGLRQPQRDLQPLFEAARGKLERTPLPGPVRSLGLHAEQLPPFVPERRDLFDPLPRGELDWPALSERLQARLGNAAIRRLQLYPDHRPEQAWRIAEAACADEDDAALPAMPRPLWLLPRAQPLRQRVRRTFETLERIETGWWDGDDVRRDYVMAELEDGQLAWLYREAGSDGPWMLHGWFA